MAKHNWVLDENGNPDEFAWENGFHNGVICKDCGFSPCVHCDEDWFEMDDCPGPRVKKTQTNGDRIRAMSDEKFAEWLCSAFGQCDWCGIEEDFNEDNCRQDISCHDCIAKWLKQPAEVHK